MLQVIIPKTYYLIPPDSNTFTLNENSTEVTITIEPGNYTLKRFRASLETILNAMSPNRYAYSVGYPGVNEPDTGKLTFTVNTVNEVSFIFEDAL
jgi:hypothetical protein